MDEVFLKTSDILKISNDSKENENLLDNDDVLKGNECLFDINDEIILPKHFSNTSNSLIKNNITNLDNKRNTINYHGNLDFKNKKYLLNQDSPKTKSKITKKITKSDEIKECKEEDVNNKLKQTNLIESKKNVLPVKEEIIKKFQFDDINDQNK